MGEIENEMKRVLEVSRYKNRDEELSKKLGRLGVALTPFEVRKIGQILGRDPTLVEIYIFDAEWSEHCSYKSSRSTLKEFLPIQAPNVIQGPEEDAGIIELATIEGEQWGLVIAHESHNHPSQVLPVEGAATGIGGIVRDVDCMGARVVAVADPLRFGDPHGDYKERVPWIVNGVVRGIWEYANALGVPNIGGDVYFDPSFDDNCLVNVVAIGIVKEKEIIHSRVPPEAQETAYDLILIGKPTDISGFGGASFASTILDGEDQRLGAVQVHDPFLKNVLLMRKANEQVLRRARELGFKIGFKDLGGGGLACASSEIGASGGFGLEIELDRVHKEPTGLPPEVIACSETQERYLLAVPQPFSKEVLAIYNQDWDLPNIYEGARASIIGRVRDDDNYILTYKGEVVCECPIQEVTKGIKYDRKERPFTQDLKEPELEEPQNLGEVLLKILASPNISSREYIYRFYDTEVQGNAFIRPGEADAGVIAPLEEMGSKVGVALSCDGNPFYGRIDPYWGGATAVAEAMRNVACVGATPSALTDCLNYGNPERPEAFWQFRQGVKGVSDAAKNLWLKGHPGAPVPIVSGNVSFYNESVQGQAIDPSPIICCVGILEDYSKALTMRFKGAGGEIYLVGERLDELGGSEYYREILGLMGKNSPKVDFVKERETIYGVIDAINAGYIRACHDISDGGMIVALVEMILGGRENRLGAEIDLSLVKGNLRNDKKLFSESSGFLMEVKPRFNGQLKDIFRDHGVEASMIGRVTEEPCLAIRDGERGLLKIGLEELGCAWKKGLSRVMR